MLIEIRNPLSRLSRTETRGRVFSCLGELCWYLAGSEELGFIEYYIPKYKDEADGPIVPGAYGPRLRRRSGVDQLSRIVTLLQAKRSSRQAVVQLFDASDLGTAVEPKGIKSVPCTCTLQFLARDEGLQLIVNMRSNDAFLGLPHDIFAFTMLQELVARSLGLPLGHYKHFVGSLHLYDEHKEKAQDFIEEGWQDSRLIMPPMPEDDPWGAVEELLRAEEAIRNDTDPELSTTLPYWADLARLLLLFRAKNKRKDQEEADRISATLHHAPYRDFFASRP
ncbi:MAG: thymidylate synthase [Planctomycetes bacterium]|nr:thymidylate synthase [Planctomycetota bacterium]